MFNRFSAIFLICFLGVLSPASVFAQQRIEIAQNSSPNLWDLLFGPQKKQVAPKKNKNPTVRRTAPNVISAPPVKVETAKAIDATRLMVIGDSLAVDLAKSLTRFYVDDPNLIIISKGVGSSGFVRDDFYDWSEALRNEIELDSFDILVVFMGINDRQPLMVDQKSAKPLSDAWRGAYTQRLSEFLNQLTSANKPVIWLGMPPMAPPKFSASLAQISALQKLASFSAGADFIDIYERFTDENGKYISRGPDISGQQVLMRKSDGIHFSRAGSDKLAFYVNQSLKGFYRSGTISLAIIDPLEGTDAGALQRLPFQGLGQLRLLQVAGAALTISKEAQRASELLLGLEIAPAPSNINFSNAPLGRVDAFVELKE